jgi:hypothetical protein
VSSTVENIFLELDIFRLTGVNTGFFHNIKVSIRTRRITEIRSIVPFVSSWVRAAWQTRAIRILEIPNRRASSGWVGAVCAIIGVRMTITIKDIVFKSDELRLAWVDAWVF